MYQDKTLICQSCGMGFIFTAGEQEYYAGHGLANEPKRCKRCREERKSAASGRSAEVVCANCGTATIVPFVPRGDKPVYCRECLRALK